MVYIIFLKLIQDYHGIEVHTNLSELIPDPAIVVQLGQYL